MGKISLEDGYMIKFLGTIIIFSSYGQIFLLLSTETFSYACVDIQNRDFTAHRFLISNNC